MTERQRLTITVKKNLLRAIDSTIDGSRIRNRSHAIEFLLSQSLGIYKLKRALILAGGPGTRMRPFTYEMPKALLPIKGRPLLAHTIASLREQGIKEIILSVGYLGEKIEEYFKDGKDFGVSIQYLKERKRAGTAGPLKLFQPFFNQPLLVIAGDTLAKINFHDLMDFHLSHGGLATLVLVPSGTPFRFGVVNIEGSRIEEFVEKPRLHKQKFANPGLVNAGIYILDPKIMGLIKKDYSMLEKDVFPKLALQHKLFGYMFEGQWFSISDPQSYELALKGWQ